MKRLPIPVARLKQIAAGFFGCCAGVLLSASPVQAQSLAGTLQATLALTSSCVISGDPNEATSGADFGTLDFGSHPSTFSGELTAQAADGAAGSGTTSIVCSPDVTAIDVAVNSGLNAGEGALIGSGARALSNGPTDFVPYDIFTTASYSTSYPTDGSGLAVSIPTPGEPFALPIFGRVNKTTSNAVATGTYNDTLTVTITF